MKDMPEIEVINQKLKEGMTVNEIATAMGLTRATIYRMLSVCGRRIKTTRKVITRD